MFKTPDLPLSPNLSLSFVHTYCIISVTGVKRHLTSYHFLSSQSLLKHRTLNLVFSVSFKVTLPLPKSKLVHLVLCVHYDRTFYNLHTRPLSNVDVYNFVTPLVTSVSSSPVVLFVLEKLRNILFESSKKKKTNEFHILSQQLNSRKKKVYTYEYRCLKRET